MPTYEYHCENPDCDNHWEQEQHIRDAPVTRCPKCDQKKARRLISRVAFSLKGRRWARDGYHG